MLLCLRCCVVLLVVLPCCLLCVLPFVPQLSERVWRTRLHVIGEYRKEEGVYEITMVQRLGGRYDGWWFTESLVADGNDWGSHIISF